MPRRPSLPTPVGPPSAPARRRRPPPDPSKDAVPFPQWGEVLERLGRSNPAAKGALTGSDAYQAGKRILIASQNPVFREMMKSNEYTRDSIKKAIMEVTGVRYGIGPYNGPAPQSQEEAPKAAPVDDILRAAQEAGVPVDIQ